MACNTTCKVAIQYLILCLGLPRLSQSPEVISPFADLLNFLWIELQHNVAEFDHPFLPRVALIESDDVRICYLHLPPAQRAYRQTLPREELDGDEVRLRNVYFRARDSVL